MEIRVFIGKDCAKCEPAKNLARELEARGYNVEIFDTSTLDGMAEAAYYSVEKTPHIIAESFGEICPDPDNDQAELERLVKKAGLLESYIFVE